MQWIVLLVILVFGFLIERTLITWIPNFAVETSLNLVFVDLMSDTTTGTENKKAHPSVEEASSGASSSETAHLKKGPWTSSEDDVLRDYVHKHGEGNWNLIHMRTGLLRSGKSCRLRWTNHLSPGLKKEPITGDEEYSILELHAKLGSKWARIAEKLPGRTDNEIKNFFNTRAKRRARVGEPLYPPELANIANERLLREQSEDVVTGRAGDEQGSSVSGTVDIPDIEFKAPELDQILLRSASDLLDLPGASSMLNRGFNPSHSFGGYVPSPRLPHKRPRDAESPFGNSIGYTSNNFPLFEPSSNGFKYVQSPVLPRGVGTGFVDSVQDARTNFPSFEQYIRSPWPLPDMVTPFVNSGGNTSNNVRLFDQSSHSSGYMHSPSPSLIRTRDVEIPAVNPIGNTSNDILSFEQNENDADAELGFTAEELKELELTDWPSSPYVADVDRINPAGSHAVVNGNPSSSQPISVALKTELPSLQYSASQGGSLELQSPPLPPLESADTSIEFLSEQFWSEYCPSPQNSGLLEDIVQESRVKMKSMNCSHPQIVETSPMVESSSWNPEPCGDPVLPIEQVPTSCIQSGPVNGSSIGEPKADEAMPGPEASPEARMERKHVSPDVLIDSFWHGQRIAPSSLDQAFESLLA